MRIIQFSDPPISHRGGLGPDNAGRRVDYLNEVARPDLVINSGDVVILDPDDDADRAAAVALHQRIDAPLRVLPGNHDVGESAVDPWRGIKVSTERVRAFRAAWGSDRFVVHGEARRDADGWAFVGINSELCGSGLPEEAEQWSWLEAAAAGLPGRPFILFLHKPLLIEAGSRDGITVAAAARQRILAAFARADLRLGARGHLPHYPYPAGGDGPGTR